MNEPTPMTLAEAAERLGVHYMTAYRYVRTGRLEASKSGGQWVVDLAAVERFGDAAKGPRDRTHVVPPLIEARLLAGDEAGCMQILESALTSGADTEEVYLDLLGPALAHVGHRWAMGEITIADEHAASATALRVIARLGAHIAPRGRTRGAIVLASVAGDHHAIPTAMLRDLLRSRGFDVHDLGADTPVDSIIHRARTVDDLLGVGLAVTTPGRDSKVRAALKALTRSLDVPVVLGGAAIRDEEHGHSLGPCLPSTSARHAIAHFESIHAQSAA